MAAAGNGFRVLVTDYVWPSVDPEREVLAAIGGELVVAPDGREETLAALAEDVDGILTCFAQVTPRVVEAAKRCVVIGRYGVGVDNIAVDTATRLGIMVTWVPDYCVDEVSDHALALLLAWNRRINLFDSSVKAGRWHVELTMPIHRLRGRTIGIIGLGRIGRALSRKAGAFGMEVVAADPFVSVEDAAAAGVRLADMNTLLEESDFVSVHTPLTPETRNLIGKDALDRMKPSAFLINVARGALIDEDALYEALKENRIAGAGLDLLVEVPPPPDHPLLGLDNVIITPHVAFFSRESVRELQVRATQEVARVLTGRMPDNTVNPQVLTQANNRTSLG